MTSINIYKHCHVTLLIIITCIAGVTRTNGLSYWTARPNDQAEQRKSFLVKDVYDSLQIERHSITLSMTDYILSIRNYIREQTLHCIKTETTSEAFAYVDFVDKHRYCGIVAFDWKTSLSFSTYTYIIESEGYMLLFNFLLFDFAWSDLHCSKHGLFIINTATNDTLCFYGKRLPWTMLLNTNNAVIRVETDRKFKISLFYSTLHVSWVHNFSKQTHMNLRKSNHIQINNLSQIEYTYSDIYYFYVRVEPIKIIAFLQHGVESNVDLMIFDGPGVLSERLHWLNNTYVTSGFSGIIQIKRLQKYTSYFLISIRSRNRSHASSTSCFHTKQVYLPISIAVSKKKGKICFEHFRGKHFFLKLAIQLFVFRDPRSLDNLHDCQFGGLFFYHPSSQKTLSVCENIESHIIYGDIDNFIMLLVWYPSYSYGVIVARLMKDQCITKHLQWNDHLEFNQVKLKDKSSIYCHRVICPTHFNKYATGENKRCNIYVNTANESFVMAKIKITKFHTLNLCQENESSYSQKVNMSFLYLEGWPMSRSRLINSWTNYSVRAIRFDFLQRFNVSLPFICHTTRPTIQVGILLSTAMCYIDTRTKAMISVYIAHKIHVKQECVDRPFDISPKEVTEFVYTLPSDDKKHTGIRTKVSYKQCPTTCKNYTFVLTILKTYNNTIHRYTSPVEKILFTGFFHEGFTLKVIPPQQHCIQKSSCEITVSFHPLLQNDGMFKGNVVFYDAQEWHIHSKRYMTVLSMIILILQCYAMYLIVLIMLVFWYIGINIFTSSLLIKK